MLLSLESGKIVYQSRRLIWSNQDENHENWRMITLSLEWLVVNCSCKHNSLLYLQAELETGTLPGQRIAWSSIYFQRESWNSLSLFRWRTGSCSLSLPFPTLPEAWVAGQVSIILSASTAIKFFHQFNPQGLPLLLLLLDDENMRRFTLDYYSKTWREVPELVHSKLYTNKTR